MQGLLKREDPMLTLLDDLKKYSKKGFVKAPHSFQPMLDRLQTVVKNESYRVENRGEMERNRWTGAAEVIDGLS